MMPPRRLVGAPAAGVPAILNGRARWESINASVQSGKYGSIAVIERLIQTVKNGCTRRLLVRYSMTAIRTEVELFSDWYNRERPHEWLAGATPDEVYRGVLAASSKPRFEPRRRFPRGATCAGPPAKIGGRRGTELALQVSFVKGRRHLPIVELKRAA